jgi:hypothetical protein
MIYVQAFRDIGMIFDHSGTTAPAGSLACPIAPTNISRTAYPALTKFLVDAGSPWGAGDGVTTIGMPWFTADHSGVQANGNVGTNTAGQVISHTHSLSAGSAGGPGQPYNYSSASSTDYGARNQSYTGGAANLAAGNRVLKCVKY